MNNIIVQAVIGLFVISCITIFHMVTMSKKKKELKKIQEESKKLKEQIETDNFLSEHRW